MDTGQVGGRLVGGWVARKPPRLFFVFSESDLVKAEHGRDLLEELNLLLSALVSLTGSL